MKKFLSLTILLAMLVCFASCGEKEAAEGCYVSLSDGSGKLVMAADYVEFKDYDEDGKITVDEVLKKAHADLKRAEDYESAAGDYGLKINKFLGDNSGSFSYYLNNASCYNLEDEVKTGDFVAAFIYQDQISWSDSYSFFDKITYEGSEITLTLKAAGFDENWNTVFKEVEAAVILIDGEESSFKTDANGQVTLSISAKGAHVISAKLEGMTLVPPVCIVTVK